MFKVENQCSDNVDNNRFNIKTVSDVENYFQISVYLIFLISIECKVSTYFDSLFLLIITNGKYFYRPIKYSKVTQIGILLKILVTLFCFIYVYRQNETLFDVYSLSLYIT